jgi:hypothetical protein
LKAIVLTWPLTSGSKLETWYGGLALKLNAPSRVRVAEPDLITLNRPTAYIIEPHWTS